ncbi:MAG: sulfotransferase [Planctomycetes bacterium]|nr:sulfotransferase [Planctomycetota bacterium]
MVSTPLFIVSAPRSGSTFLRAGLDAHPEITLSNEAGWVAALRKAELLTTTPSMHPVDDGEGFTGVGLVPLRYLDATRAAFQAAAQAFARCFAEQLHPFGRYSGDKVHSHNDAEFLVRTFPGLRLVYLVRDIRDVLVSSYTFEQKQLTAWQGASFEQRCTHLARFLDRMAELLRDHDPILVRYEELVADPRAQFTAVLRGLGLEMCPAVEDWLAHEAEKLFRSHGTSVEPSASIGRWRSALSEEQQALAAELLGRQNRALGYG